MVKLITDFSTSDNIFDYADNFNDNYYIYLNKKLLNQIIKFQYYINKNFENLLIETSINNSNRDPFEN